MFYSTYIKFIEKDGETTTEIIFASYTATSTELDIPFENLDWIHNELKFSVNPQ